MPLTEQEYETIRRENLITEAANILNHHLDRIAIAAGVDMDCECQQEIRSVVEKIVAAAKGAK